MVDMWFSGKHLKVMAGQAQAGKELPVLASGVQRRRLQDRTVHCQALRGPVRSSAGVAGFRRTYCMMHSGSDDNSVLCHWLCGSNIGTP